MLEESIVAALTTAPTITAFLGTPASRPDSTNGVFPEQAIEQVAMPYLVLSQVSGASLSEALDGTGDLTSERWRFSCHGTTYKNAKKFAKAVRKFLISLKGSQPGGAFINGAQCLLEADASESLGKGTLYSTTLDVEFEYNDLE